MRVIPQSSPSVRIARSGPLSVAELECRDCSGLSTLLDTGCRRCVIQKLSAEGDFDQLVLRRAYTRVYCSPDLPRLIRAFVIAEQLACDRTLYAVSEKDDACRKCVDGRMRALQDTLDHLKAHPHDLTSLDTLAEEAVKRSERCRVCSKERFLTLLDHIKTGLSEVASKLTEKNYDEFFMARVKPFFVEGVWHPPPADAVLIDQYRLPERDGMVRIYKQPGNPTPFYELVLPEFRLPAEQLELLESVYRLEFRGAPGHARFAYPERARGFSEEWYNTLLSMAGGGVSAIELRKLARYISSWLTYRVLEPLSYDDHLTDIYIHAPPEHQPIVVEHDRFGKCETGIYLSTPTLLGLGEALATRLGVAFDEVRPQLDVEIPELGMRLFMSRQPAIWARSVEVAVRKRRRKPWTQPLFLERGTLTPLASSFLSNALRLGASAFVIGEIGTAKTSQVETYIPEIGSDQRIIAFQDTEELHIEDFTKHGYKLANVRITGPEQLEQQINAFLRGGPSYWLLAEVRAEAVRSALGAAARQGSQPVITSYHARSKEGMFDLIVNIMGLHETAFKYIDLIISTARFSGPQGTIRRIVEVAEVLKGWSGKPEYVELFVDDRRRDLLVPGGLLRGNANLLKRLNSYDLSDLDPVSAGKKVEFLPPDEGGSQLIPTACRKLALDEKDFLTSLLVEAKMKSDLLMLYRKSGDIKYLELPFVGRAYNYYFSLVKEHAPDYGRILGGWKAWLKRI